MGLSGLLKVAQLENPRLVTQLIGIEGNESLAELAQRLRENARRQDAVIRYENGARLVERLQEMGAPAASANLFKP
jgi:polyketide synthase PksN